MENQKALFETEPEPEAGPSADSCAAAGEIIRWVKFVHDMDSVPNKEIAQLVISGLNPEYIPPFLDILPTAMPALKEIAES